MTKRISAANGRRSHSLAERYSGERRLHQPIHPNGGMIADRFSQLHQAFHPLPKRQGTHHLPGHGCFLIQFQPRLTIKLLHRALYGDAEAFANSLPPALPQV